MKVFSFNRLVQLANDEARKDIESLIKATKGKFITNVDGKTKEELIAAGRDYWANIDSLFIEREN